MSIITKLRAPAIAIAGIALVVAGCVKYDEPETFDVQYRGHSYIVFRVRVNRGQTYVHDPDCECNNMKKGGK